MREEFTARDEGEDKVEESGVHAAADHLHYEGVADRAEDPLLVLHVFDLFVPDHDSHYLDHDWHRVVLPPDDVLQGHDLESVVLVSLLMLAE